MDSLNEPHDKYRLKHVDKQVTYRFSLYGCDSLFEWTQGSTRVCEVYLDQHGSYRGSHEFSLDHICADLKGIVRQVREIKLSN